LPIDQKMALPLLFSLDVTLRWRDMDSYQHVNNSEYLTLCEECRIHWFASLPGPWRSIDAEPVVARIELNYISPMHYPHTVRISLFFERLGNSSLTLQHQLRSADDPNILFAEGKTVLVWSNPATGKSTPVPSLIRDTLPS
jgi:acyl-CoA thioester hydrolase